jgi:hypothetical protein
MTAGDERSRRVRRACAAAFTPFNCRRAWLSRRRVALLMASSMTAAVLSASKSSGEMFKTLCRVAVAPLACSLGVVMA